MEKPPSIEQPDSLERSPSQLREGLRRLMAAGLVSATLAGCDSEDSRQDRLSEALVGEQDMAVAEIVDVFREGYTGTEEELLRAMAPQLESMCYESDKEWNFSLEKTHDGIWSIGNLAAGDANELGVNHTLTQENVRSVYAFHNHPLETQMTFAHDEKYEKYRTRWGVEQYGADLVTQVAEAFRSHEINVPPMPPGHNDLGIIMEKTLRLTQDKNNEVEESKGFVAGCNGVWSFGVKPGNVTPEEFVDFANSVIKDEWGDLENYGKLQTKVIAPYSTDVWNAYFAHGDRSQLDMEYQQRQEQVVELVQAAENLGIEINFVGYDDLQKSLSK